MPMPVSIHRQQTQKLYNMEVQLKVTNVLPPLSGVSKQNKEWTKQRFVGETQEQYPKQILVNIFNPTDEKPCPLVGDLVTVSFDIESRSFKGNDGVERWATDIMAWRVVNNTEVNTNASLSSSAPPLPQTQYQEPAAPQVLNVPQSPTYQPPQQPQYNDDLPF